MVAQPGWLVKNSQLPIARESPRGRGRNGISGLPRRAISLDQYSYKEQSLEKPGHYSIILVRDFCHEEGLTG
jgi:hypothetical protein